MENAEKYKEYGIPATKGILFFGPPGCGKSFFAKVVADECNANFFTVNGPELLGGGIGQSEANLRQKFRDARETNPAIIFFDEIDAIAEDRSSGSGSVRLINQLLTEMDGMESLDGVMVIAATNRPEKLDSALMRAGRFDTKIYIPMPDELSRKELFASSPDKIPYNLDLFPTRLILRLLDLPFAKGCNTTYCCSNNNKSYSHSGMKWLASYARKSHNICRYTAKASRNYIAYRCKSILENQIYYSVKSRKRGKPHRHCPFLSAR